MTRTPPPLVLFLLLIAALLTLSAPITAQTDPAPHRLAIRVVDGVGEFYDTVTGERFVPRGVNFIDWKYGDDRYVHDWAFETRQFDPDHVRRAFRDLAAHGYNTARMFLDLCSSGPYCINNPSGDGINPAYLDNVATVMRIAAEEGIYLLLTSNDLPQEGGYWQLVDRGLTDTIGGYRNANYLTEAGVDATRQYWDAIMSYLAAQDAPFSALLGWQLLNEQFFLLDIPPFSLESGTVTVSTGRYDMANPEQRRQMAYDTLIYYIEEVSAVIRTYDPDSLITMGFFSPESPTPWIPDPRYTDTRYVDTGLLLADSPLDFFDLHGYPGDLSLAEVIAHFGLPDSQEKPIIMGEVGAFHAVYGSVDMAAYDVQRWIAATCQYGFDGWLYWEYYGGPAILGDDTWGLAAEDGYIRDALSPLNQPDPCVTTGLPLANAAFERPATASRSLPGEPASNLTDGTPNQWGAGSDAPQWLEIDLGNPATLGEVRLTVAQWPAGATVHQVWARLADGSLVLLDTLRGETSEGQRLSVALPVPLPDVAAIRVETLESPSWVAWQEVEAMRAEAAGAPCLVWSANGANLRDGPGTSYAVAGSLPAGRGAVVSGQESGADGFTWYVLGGGTYVREDVIRATGDCAE